MSFVWQLRRRHQQDMEDSCKRIPHQINRPYCHNYGNITNSKEEGDPHKVGDKKQDMKSEEVIERVKLLKVQDPIMNPKKPKTHSPFSDIVNDRTSFV